VALGRNLYYPPQGVSSSGSPVNGSLAVAPVPLCIDRVALVTAVTWKINTAGTTGALFRPVIYADDGTGTMPGALLWDGGTFDATVTGVGTATPTALAITSGVIWLGGVTQGTPTTVPVLTTVNNNSGIALPMTTNDPGQWSMAAVQSAVTGAAPSAFTTTPAYTSLVPRMTLRLN